MVSGMKVLRRIFSARSVVNWARAIQLMSQGNYQMAADILSKVDLPEGDMQIAMVHLGNCLYHMNKKSEAVEAYEAAIALEKSQVPHRPLDDSRYLVLFCRFFIHAVDQGKFAVKNDDLQTYNSLMSCRVSDKLKGLLPVPNRSQLRT
jgi:tetratricopeptide (TPR) repeat protein